MSSSEAATIGPAGAATGSVALPPGARSRWSDSTGAARTRRLSLRFVALLYLLALLGAPVAMILPELINRSLLP